MFFAYAMVSTPQGRRAELSIIPKKITSENLPVPVHDLIQSECGLFYIGGDEVTGHESVAVRTLTGESGIEIKPVRPSILYVTSHNPERPGERAEGITVKINDKGAVIVLIKRTPNEDWIPFNPGPRFFATT